jgi:hypothetical protein
MHFEVEEIGDQSGAGVASDFNLLPEIPEIEGEDVVLLAMARETLLEQHAQGHADAHLVGLASLGGVTRLTRPAAVEPRLDVVFAQRDARRHPVDHAADRRPVAFAPGGKPKGVSETVTWHGYFLSQRAKGVRCGGLSGLCSRLR